MVTEDDLDDASAALRGGAVVAVPTDTVYGLAVRADEPGATRALFALKGRPERTALPVLVTDLAMALEIVTPTDDRFTRLARVFWPGALTLVAPMREGVTLAIGGDGRTVGVRCPAHDGLRALIARTGPLAVSSANRSGAPPATSASEVVEIFGGAVLVLDGGVCDGAPSTVAETPPTGGVAVLRSGPVTEDALRAALRAS